MGQSNKRRFYSLDAFRGLFALLISLIHIEVAGTFTSTPLIQGTAILVDFFFLLSGFVLAHAYLTQNDLKFVYLLKKRFKRLYPLHIYTLVLFVFLALISNRFNKEGSILDLFLNSLLLQSWLPFANSYSFNYSAWSISIEFYLSIFCFSIFALGRKTSYFISIALAMLAAMALLVFPNNFYTPALKGATCLFLGVFGHFLFLKLKPIKLGFLIATLFEFVLIIFCVKLISLNHFFPPYFAYLTFLLMVLTFSKESGLISLFLKHRIFQFLGKISYSIYMINSLLFFILISINGNKSIDFGNQFFNYIFLILSLFLLVVSSALSYRYLERFPQFLRQ